MPRMTNPGIAWTDAVFGPLEFSVYGCAVILACQHNDPGALSDQMIRFTGFNLRRSLDVYQRGQKDFAWERQSSYLTFLRTDHSAEPIRKVLNDLFEGVWLTDAKPDTRSWEQTL